MNRGNAASIPPEATEVLSDAQLREREPGRVLLPGSELGPYVLERVIGSGGCGIVYEARHRTMGRRAAIKVLRGEVAVFPSVVARFVREAEALNRIRHPNIVDILEFGRADNGLPYYVMELLEGVDLESLVQAHGRFSPSETLALLEPVCMAVKAAHQAGILHRDIKARNIMVVEARADARPSPEQGDPRPRIKLLDFGIAKLLHNDGPNQGLTEPGARIGSVHNMAPEQVRCDALDERADIYALGVVLYQLLTGQLPFQAEDPLQVALMHLTSPAPRPSAAAGVAPALDVVVLRCLEKVPDRRYGSVAELLSALQTAVGEVPSEAATSVRGLGLYFEISSAADEKPDALVADAHPSDSGLGVRAPGALDRPVFASSGADGAPLDDALFVDLGYVLDVIEQALTEHGFSFPLRTSNALLGVRAIVDEPPEQARAEAEALLAELSVQLSERPDAHPSVAISASLSLGQVQCRASEAGSEFVGGPLLEVATWTEPGRVVAARATE